MMRSRTTALSRRCSSPGRSRHGDVSTGVMRSPPPLQMPFAFEVFTCTLPRSSTVLITGSRPPPPPDGRSTSGAASLAAMLVTWSSSAMTSSWLQRRGTVTTTVGSERSSECDTRRDVLESDDVGDASELPGTHDSGPRKSVGQLQRVDTSASGQRSYIITTIKCDPAHFFVFLWLWNTLVWPCFSNLTYSVPTLESIHAHRTDCSRWTTTPLTCGYDEALEQEKGHLFSMTRYSHSVRAELTRLVKRGRRPFAGALWRHISLSTHQRQHAATTTAVISVHRYRQ